MSKKQPFLSIRLEGPRIGKARMPAEELVALTQELTRAARRVAIALSSQEDSRRAGRLPKGVEKSLALDIVGFTHGSVASVVQFERSEHEVLDGELFDDDTNLGTDAYTCLFKGLRSNFSGKTLPKGFDKGVLIAVRSLGELLNRGVNRVDFTLNHRAAPLKATLDESKYNRVRKRIEEPIMGAATIVGRLLMADFKEEREQIRIEPSLGKPVMCSYPDHLKDTVKENLTRFVRATGEAEIDTGTHDIKHLYLTDLEHVGEPVPGELSIDESAIGIHRFWQGKTLAELVEIQGIQPISSFESLRGGWPEDQLDDGFEDELQRWRRQRSER